MKIAIYGKTFNQGFGPYITELLNVLEEHNTQMVVYKPFFDFISNISFRLRAEREIRGGELPAQVAL